MVKIIKAKVKRTKARVKMVTRAKTILEIGIRVKTQEKDAKKPLLSIETFEGAPARLLSAKLTNKENFYLEL